MELTEQTISFIKNWEGCRLFSYQDTGGVWTIGWGTTGPEIVQGLVWTQSEADEALEDTLEILTEHLEEKILVPLNDNELTALTSLIYNIGTTHFDSSTLLQCLNAGSYNAAGNEFVRWNRIKGVPNEGLLRRRLAEQKLFFTNSFI